MNLAGNPSTLTVTWVPVWFSQHHLWQVSDLSTGREGSPLVSPQCSGSTEQVLLGVTPYTLAAQCTRVQYGSWTWIPPLLRDVITILASSLCFLHPSLFISIVWWSSLRIRHGYKHFIYSSLNFDNTPLRLGGPMSSLCISLGLSLFIWKIKWSINSLDMVIRV